MDHLGPALSAYLDGALEPAERAAAESHLAGCATCRDRLAELRATARLVAAVPAARPSRSLVPHLTVVPVWARPVRSLAAVTSGLFVLVFIAAAALSTGLGGGGKGSLLGPIGAGSAAAQPAPAAPLATAAPNARSAFASPDPAAPVPAASFGFAPTQLSGTSRQPGALQSDATKAVSGPSGQGGPIDPAGAPGASARADAASPAPTLGATYGVGEPSSAQLGPTPLLWLALALVSALIAFVAHRRAHAA